MVTQQNTSAINDLRISIINFNEQTSIEITDIAPHFNIFESIFSQYCTCEVIITDSINLLSKLPIVGEEYVTIQYRTAGLKGGDAKEEYTLRTRSFRIYKLSEREENNEGTQNYKLHGIDDHCFVNEAYSVNQSYVGQNCIAACEATFKSYFIDPVEFRPFDKQLFNLVDNGNGITEKKYETADEFKSVNNSTYIAPGITPVEVINYLKDEAVHQDTEETSNYLFFQNVNGFHLRTLGNLKEQSAKYTYFLKNTIAEDVGIKESESSDLTTTIIRNSILSYEFIKQFDTLNSINNGFYGNRVVVIDLLTKKFDERIFTYNTEWPRLNPIERGPEAAKLHSDSGTASADINMLATIGSTQTRYISSELLSNSIPTGNPTNFSANESPSYKQTPYFYPIDKKDPDEMRDKLTGTLTNYDAKYRMVAFVRDDNKLKNPRLKHEKLNREIATISSLDNIILNLMVPGNSDLQAGDIIHAFIPDNQNETKYMAILGQTEPRLLVTDVRQTYLLSEGTYMTALTCVKDSLNISVEKLSQLGFGQE
jgi:hypothetical protein